MRWESNNQLNKLGFQLILLAEILAVFEKTSFFLKMDPLFIIFVLIKDIIIL